jgi:hypothetical protein
MGVGGGGEWPLRGEVQRSPERQNQADRTPVQKEEQNGDLYEVCFHQW